MLVLPVRLIKDTRREEHMSGWSTLPMSYMDVLCELVIGVHLIILSLDVTVVTAR